MDRSVHSLTQGLEFTDFDGVCDYVSEHIPYGRRNLFLERKYWRLGDPSYVEEIRHFINDEEGLPEVLAELQRTDILQMDALLSQGLRDWGADGRLIAFARSVKTGHFDLLEKSLWVFADIDLKSRIFSLNGQEVYRDPKFVLADLTPDDHPIFEYIRERNRPGGDRSDPKIEIGDPGNKGKQNQEFWTGTPGRPSSKHLIEQEFERRVAAGRVESSLATEGRVLAGWIAASHPSAPRPTNKTIENMIRSGYNRQKIDCANKPTK